MNVPWGLCKKHCVVSAQCLFDCYLNMLKLAAPRLLLFAQERATNPKETVAESLLPTNNPRRPQDLPAVPVAPF